MPVVISEMKWVIVTDRGISQNLPGTEKKFVRIFTEKVCDPYLFRKNACIPVDGPGQGIHEF